MPITENSFTADELHAALTANPTLEAQLKTFGQKANYAIRTKAEDETFVTGLKNETINSKTSEFANGIEADIKAVFGVDKKENEKYHEYLKRVGGEAATQLQQMKTELATLKADPDKTGADKIRITQLEAAIQTEKNGASEKLKQKDTEISNLKAGFEIEKSLGAIRGTYLLGVPEFAIKATEQAVIDSVRKEMSLIEDKWVILDAEKKPLLDKSTYQPITVEQYLKEKLKDLIDPGRKAAGAGTPAEQQQQQQANQEGVIKDAQGNITDVTQVPATIKTKVELHDHLCKLGLLDSSDVFVKLYKKYGEKLPLR